MSHCWCHSPPPCLPGRLRACALGGLLLPCCPLPPTMPRTKPGTWGGGLRKCVHRGGKGAEGRRRVLPPGPFSQGPALTIIPEFLSGQYPLRGRLEMVWKAKPLSGLENLRPSSSFPSTPRGRPPPPSFSQLRGQGSQHQTQPSVPFSKSQRSKAARQGGARPPQCPGLRVLAFPVPGRALVTAQECPG